MQLFSGFKSCSLYSSRSLVALALTIGAAAVLSGCVVAPAYPVDGYSYGGDVYAPMAPPPVRTEIIPIAPAPSYVWIGGSWGWSGSRYDWRPGRWAAPPRPGYSWQARPWSHGPRGWSGGGGRWRR